MEFRALSLCFLLLYVGYCNANSEDSIDFYKSYWHSVFPTDTPFPEVLQQFLPSELQGVGRSMFDGNNILPRPFGPGRADANKNALPQPYGVYYTWANKNSLPQPYGVYYTWANKNSLPNSFGVGSWRSKNAQSQPHQFKSEKNNPPAAKFGDHDATDLTSYFFEKDLVVGNKMKMEFQKAVTEAKLLPRQVIESIPFSIKLLPEILSLYNINPESADAKIVTETIQLCERPLNPQIEVQFCATSFESLVDYVVSRLGRNNVQAYATEADSEERKEYTIEENGVELLGDKSVICHLQNYVHAVFYCHELKSTKAYRVSLLTSDGAKAKAVVLCHHDTSGSDPNNLPFKMLNVMPGREFPICHFLVRGSHAWVANPALSNA